MLNFFTDLIFLCTGKMVSKKFIVTEVTENLTGSFTLCMLLKTFTKGLPHHVSLAAIPDILV